MPKCVFPGEMNSERLSMIGQLRSLIPERINIMALTGTATKNTFDIILQRLGMWEPAIVGVSCNWPNIKLIIQPKQKLEEFGLQISQRLQNEGLSYPKTIVFCTNYKDCTGLYLSLVENLRENLTYPPGYPDLLQYRYVTMYTRASTEKMKEMVIDQFSKQNSSLRLIIATAALSMGETFLTLVKLFIGEFQVQSNNTDCMSRKLDVLEEITSHPRPY